MKAYCFDACQSEFKSNQRRKRFANLLFYCKRISITFMVRRCVQQWSICGICVETHFDIFATMWMWWLNCTLNWVDFLDCIHFDVLLNLDNAEHSNTQLIQMHLDISNVLLKTVYFSYGDVAMAHACASIDLNATPRQIIMKTEWESYIWVLHDEQNSFISPLFRRTFPSAKLNWVPLKRLFKYLFKHMWQKYTNTIAHKHTVKCATPRST